MQTRGSAGGFGGSETNKKFIYILRRNFIDDQCDKNKEVWIRNNEKKGRGGNIIDMRRIRESIEDGELVK